MIINVRPSRSVTYTAHHISRAPQAVLIVLSRWRMDKGARDPTKPPKGTHVKDCTDWLPNFVDSSWQCLFVETRTNPIICCIYIHLAALWTREIKLDNQDGKNTTNKIWTPCTSAPENPWTGLFQYFSFLNFHGCCGACTRQGLGYFNMGQ